MSDHLKEDKNLDKKIDEKVDEVIDSAIKNAEARQELSEAETGEIDGGVFIIAGGLRRVD